VIDCLTTASLLHMLPAGDSQGVKRNINCCAPKRQQAWNGEEGGRALPGTLLAKLLTVPTS